MYYISYTPFVIAHAYVRFCTRAASGPISNFHLDPARTAMQMHPQGIFPLCIYRHVHV